MIEKRKQLRYEPTIWELPKSGPGQDIKPSDQTITKTKTANIEMENEGVVY